jgi:hypothetical protein
VRADVSARGVVLTGTVPARSSAMPSCRARTIYGAGVVVSHLQIGEVGDPPG